MRPLLILFLVLCGVGSKAQQLRFSVASDISVLRNFSPSQRFWALGQTVQTQLHVDKHETLFGNIRYYSPGNFKNTFTATAASPLTVPATKNYRVSGSWNLKEIVLGWKHYFKGSFDAETSWNLYGFGGFGLIFTSVENGLATSIDTTVYKLQAAPEIGSGHWKRLSIDLGMGGEYPMGGNFFLYSEVQTWIHTSAYPSPFLHRNERVPFPVTLDIGLRILFGE